MTHTNLFRANEITRPSRRAIAMSSRDASKTRIAAADSNGLITLSNSRPVALTMAAATRKASLPVTARTRANGRTVVTAA
jgi:hypothetical protein